MGKRCKKGGDKAIYYWTRFFFRSCPRCNGDVFVDRDTIALWFLECLQCGWLKWLEGIQAKSSLREVLDNASGVMLQMEVQLVAKPKWFRISGESAECVRNAFKQLKGRAPKTFIEVEGKSFFALVGRREEAFIRDVSQNFGVTYAILAEPPEFPSKDWKAQLVSSGNGKGGNGSNETVVGVTKTKSPKGVRKMKWKPPYERLVEVGKETDMEGVARRFNLSPAFLSEALKEYKTDGLPDVKFTYRCSDCDWFAYDLSRRGVNQLMNHRRRTHPKPIADATTKAEETRPADSDSCSGELAVIRKSFANAQTIFTTLEEQFAKLMEEEATIVGMLEENHAKQKANRAKRREMLKAYFGEAVLAAGLSDSALENVLSVLRKEVGVSNE